MIEIDSKLVNDFIKENKLNNTSFVVSKRNGVDLSFYMIKKSWYGIKIAINTIKYYKFCDAIHTLLGSCDTILFRDGDIYLCDNVLGKFEPNVCFKHYYDTN